MRGASFHSSMKTVIAAMCCRCDRRLSRQRLPAAQPMSVISPPRLATRIVWNIEQPADHSIRSGYQLAAEANRCLECHRRSTETEPPMINARIPWMR